MIKNKARIQGFNLGCIKYRKKLLYIQNTLNMILKILQILKILKIN
jgi:hypothetical protein